MNRIKQIADNYGVTTCELAELMGYSRQALYTGGKHDKRRVAEAIKLLEQDNLTRLAADCEQAQIDFDWRRGVIEDLERFLS